MTFSSVTGRTATASDLMASLGREVGVSGWFAVSQPVIDQFADATRDHQFIHVDPERAAAETPFGGTIAHGFLSLSLLSAMAYEALPRIENAVMGINYGFNRLRFLAPVKSGERVRGCFVLRDVAQKDDDQLLVTYDVTVEIEGGARPALVAEWLTLSILGSA